MVLPFQVPAASVPTPVIPVYEPFKRPVGNVPLVMLAALVVSVVAEAARPETAAAAIAIAVGVAAVT
jgi:hypothetical protein